MESKGVAAQVVKICGLVLVIYGVAYVPHYISAYLHETPYPQSDPYGDKFLGMVVLPVCVPLLIGIILMWIPEKISRLVVGPPAEKSEIPKQLQVIIFTAIGLYVALDGVLGLVWSIGYYGFIPHLPSPEPYRVATIHRSVAGLVVGVVLALRADGVSRLITSLRRANTEVKPPR